MTEPRLLRQHLQVADGLPSLLAASWDAFDFLQVTASRFDDTATCRHAYAFLLATAAAGRGRHSIGTAPSLPDGCAAPPNAEPFGQADEDQAVQAVAGLAELLETRLTVTLTSAANPGDQVACTEAAAAAAEIRTLLAGGGGQCPGQFWVTSSGSPAAA
jgi:hypothetical protein